MRQYRGTKRGKLQNRVANQSDGRKVPHDILALDRTLVELSMRLYKVPQRERLMLRGHIRRLHHSVRQGQCSGARTSQDGKRTGLSWAQLLF